ncbi:MAG TPA: helix-turn-helix transcriptional regulator [Solirubrobacterales bacterium]
MPDRGEALARFGRNLRSPRLAAGLSQEELAVRAGVSRSYVGRLEAGVSECRFITAMALADGLGVGIEDLIDGIASAPDAGRTPDQGGRE